MANTKKTDLLKEPIEVRLRVILDLNSPTLFVEFDDTDSSPQRPLHFLDRSPDIRV